MSKREQERKLCEEEKATAQAFQEFITTFQETSGPPNKLFVKSGILHAKSGEENEYEKGKLYNPKPIVRRSNETIKKAIECARLVKENIPERTKGCGKPKSNLEQLKEELRLKHLERDEQIKNAPCVAQFNAGNYESDDVTTTNLFVANMNPNTTERDLMQMFGVYGPLASVKIMWPRNETRVRSNNVGFVAFMSRKDGERALENLKVRDDMRIGWAKSIEIPKHPVYIPSSLLKSMLPPPQTGLPFNAQPKIPYEYPQNRQDMNKLLYQSTVKVTVPLDKKILAMIHRTVEFVVREGPRFEAMIMNKEINNPTFKFLFDNKSPNHIYYRWKLYSILNGESPNNWSTKEFRMFKDGSVWLPPPLPNYTLGMPDYIFKTDKIDKKLLSRAQETRLINFIQNLTMSRSEIAEAMIFCLNHEEAAKDVVEIISDSFENDATSPMKKISRLYLVSDILYNSGIKRINRMKLLADEIEKRLPHIFEAMQRTHKNLTTELDRDNFKLRVFKVLHSWDTRKIVRPEQLRQLEKLFSQPLPNNVTDYSDTDEPLDGKNMIKRYLQNSQEEKIDPAVTILNETKRKIEPPNPSDFVTSKWKSVKPEEVEAQAMSTKKMFDLEKEKHRKERERPEESKKLSEQERGHLRKIEMMVMQYQDDLESGKRSRKRGDSIDGEVMRYRKKLLEKNKHEKYRNTSRISIDSSSSDEERKEYRRSKKYTKKKSYRDKDKYNKRYRK